MLGTMDISCKWNEKLSFSATADGHLVPMDSKPPLGGDTAMTPKQLVVAGLCGCTAMDVAALLKKHKQPVESFTIDAHVEASTGAHPIVFQSVHLVFKVTGAVDAQKVIESVTLSQTKYCGVSAMLSKAVPIQYTVVVNGAEVGTGSAAFIA